MTRYFSWKFSNVVKSLAPWENVVWWVPLDRSLNDRIAGNFSLMEDLIKRSVLEDSLDA